MPRPPRAREPLKQAALRRFVEYGIHATGIRDIAKDAGCSEAALYRHWPNKEQLVGQLFQEHLESVVTLMRDHLGGPGDLASRVRAGCQALYTLYDEQPMVFRFVLLVQHEVAHYLPKDLDMPQDVLIEVFSKAAAEGETDGDPVLLSAACIGIFLQTATYVIYKRLDPPLIRYVDSVSAHALCLLRPSS
ncbi:MAG: TetR/AcrR family transcriptional regulator [Planctomycetota bacterium]